MRTYEVKGQLTIQVKQIDTGHQFSFTAEDVTLRLTYSVASASLGERFVVASEIELQEALLTHDAIFESEEGIMLIARRGTKLSAFIPTETWRSWQREIASDLSRNEPHFR